MLEVAGVYPHSAKSQSNITLYIFIVALCILETLNLLHTNECTVIL